MFKRGTEINTFYYSNDNPLTNRENFIADWKWRILIFNLSKNKQFVIFTEGELNLKSFLYEILMIPAIERGRGTGTDVLERRRTPRRKISDGDDIG